MQRHTEGKFSRSTATQLTSISVVILLHLLAIAYMTVHQRCHDIATRRYHNQILELRFVPKQRIEARVIDTHERGATPRMKKPAISKPAITLGSVKPTNYTAVSKIVAPTELQSIQPHGPHLDLAQLKRFALADDKNQSKTATQLLNERNRLSSARESKFEQSVQRAEQKDCRTAYADLGLFAAIPLALNTATNKGCRW